MRFLRPARPAAAAAFLLSLALLELSVPLVAQNLDASCERERNLERELRKVARPPLSEAKPHA